MKIKKLTQKRLNAIRKFWFGHMPHHGIPKQRQIQLWDSSNTFDQRIRQEYLSDIFYANTRDMSKKLIIPRHRLTLIIILDQFPKRVFLDSSLTHTQQIQALQWAKTGIQQKIDCDFKFIERLFLYLPLSHAEDLPTQVTAVQLFENLLNEIPEDKNSYFLETIKKVYENYHIIKKFGRFPQKNASLKRQSTPEELEFLKKINSGNK